MRTNLNVPFAEKDEAKRLGARWDPARKTWYVQNAADLTPFARWMQGAATPEAATRRAAPAAIERVGSAYVAMACDCLPWEGCAKCRAQLLDSGWLCA